MAQEPNRPAPAVAAKHLKPDSAWITERQQKRVSFAEVVHVAEVAAKPEEHHEDISKPGVKPAEIDTVPLKPLDDSPAVAAPQIDRSSGSGSWDHWGSWQSWGARSAVAEKSDASAWREQRGASQTWYDGKWQKPRAGMEWQRNVAWSTNHGREGIFGSDNFPRKDRRKKQMGNTFRRPNSSRL